MGAQPDPFTEAALHMPLSRPNIDNLLSAGLKDISQPCDATSWMDIIRTLRQPQHLWKIDYIEAGPRLSDINRIIVQSETLLYGDKKNLRLKPGYSADIYQEIGFHTIRAHLRAEEGDISAATGIFKELLANWYDELIPIRQTNLLMHGCLAALCCMEFEDSYTYFQKHWTLLKYSEENDRVGLGIWDNHVILQLIYWFFIKHVVDFKDFYAIKSKLRYTSELHCHKKIPVLNFLDYDHSLVVSFCALPFYNHARKLMPTLPEHETKRSTPINSARPIISEPGSGHINQPVGKEKYYYDQFNLETKQMSYVIDQDLADNFLYSYYSFQNNYVQDGDRKEKLLCFANSHITVTDCDSVFEAGCGKIPLKFNHTVRHTCVDISEVIYGKLKDKKIPCIQQSIVNFLHDTSNTFDLCFTCDILQTLTLTKLKMFLSLCQKKCKYIVALINTDKDVRTEIINQPHNITEVNVNKTLLTHDKWIALLSAYFTIKHNIDQSWLYVFGESVSTTPTLKT